MWVRRERDERARFERGRRRGALRLDWRDDGVDDVGGAEDAMCSCAGVGGGGEGATRARGLPDARGRI